MAYLMAGQSSELDRLQLQARVWEPIGEQLLARLGDGAGLHALEIGCGAMGWLRILSRWVGPSGSVTGTDVDENMLAAANTLCSADSITNVTVLRDDIFSTTLPAASFDLVHLRFQLAPLGHASELVATAHRLLKPGGWLVLEEPDTGGWRENPVSPAADRLRALVLECFARVGGDLNAGRLLPEHLRSVGITPSIHAACLALEPGHPYLRLPVQFAASLRPRLLQLVSEAELDQLIESANEDFSDPTRWGLSYALIQCWGRRP